MKKTLLTIASALLIVSAQAFPTKGSPYLGGSLGFNSSTGKFKPATGTGFDFPKTTSWNFSPEVGYFIADHFSVGLGLNIAGSSTVEENPTPSLKERTTKTMTTGVMLNARKYFQMSESFHTFAGLDININPGKMEVEEVPNAGNTTTDESKMMGFGADLNLGIAWSVTEKIMIFGKYGFLGYNTNTTTTDNGAGGDDKSTNSNFGLNVNTYGNPLNVGMYFLLK